MSTAFPQPKPGTAAGPGPMKVDPGQLRSVLGITSVEFVTNRGALAVIDTSLASASGEIQQVGIDNFCFTPAALSISTGEIVEWTNRDDVPHTVVEVAGRFKSQPLDTGGSYRHRFQESGTFEYFCSVHPKMTGKVIVR
jgi:plastocyanin